MAVFTPSYPLTFPTVVGVQTQRFSLVRTVAVSSSPFTGPVSYTHLTLPTKRIV